MKNILFIALFGALYQLFGSSTVSISSQKCFKARYGHTIGGTLHSKRVLFNRLVREEEKLLRYSKEEALAILQKKYPNLALDSVSFTIKNCYGYYQSGRNYFDPNTFELIKQKREQK